jgi:endonuclease III
MHENLTADAKGTTDSTQHSNNDLSDSQSLSTNASSFSTRKRKRNVSAQTGTQKKTVKVEKSTTIETTAKASKRSKTRQPAKRITDKSRNVTMQPPSGWEALYSHTKEMRKRISAPVDTMGCERLADENAPPRDQRFQTLVSLMLSSQTKDTVTSAAVRSMQSTMPGGLTLQSILEIEPDRLNEFIGKIGFHNIKTKNIKRVAEILRDQFDGDIPDTIEGLTSLPGVGPKMAYLCMSVAWGRDEGIGVDVHVHRITNLWKWHKTNNPEETRIALQSWLPQEKWHEINWLLVGLGQTICLPVGRKCGECDLGLKGLCPSAVGVRKVKEAKVEVKLEEDVPL